MSEPTIITVDSYQENPEHRELADRLMSELHLDPKRVHRMHINDDRVLVRVVDRHPITGVWSYRTCIFSLRDWGGHD